MDKIDLNSLLNRNELATKIKNLLKDFENNKNNFSFKRGIYLYGSPGISVSNN